MNELSKRNVYLIQANYDTGSGQFSSHWIPYSVGCLWAYAIQFADITEKYKLAGLYFQRTPVDEVVAGMESPAVVGFSHYIWSANYNCALAKAIKAKWPDTIIVFGGPEVPDDPISFFHKHPYIDITVHKEGEVTFTQLLLELLKDKSARQAVPGTAIVNNDGKVIIHSSGGRI